MTEELLAWCWSGMIIFIGAAIVMLFVYLTRERKP